MNRNMVDQEVIHHKMNSGYSFPVWHQLQDTLTHAPAVLGYTHHQIWAINKMQEFRFSVSIL